MLRTLCPDLEQRVAAQKLQLQWQRAIRFAQRDLLPLLNNVPDAPPQSLAEGLAFLPHPQDRFPSAEKWFNFLAKGREYRGKLALLLEDMAPELDTGLARGDARRGRNGSHIGVAARRFRG